MEGRTRILITHHVGLCVTGASFVVHLENGRIDFCGSPEELEVSGKLGSILDDVVTHSEEAKEQTIEEEIDLDKSINVQAATALGKPDDKVAKVLVQEESKFTVYTFSCIQPTFCLERAVGHVKLSLYKLYFKSLGGHIYWIVFFAFLFGSRALDVAESWWIKQWVHANESGVVNATISFMTQARYVLVEHPVTQTLALLDQNIKPSQQLGFLVATNDGDNKNDQLNMYLSIYILITVTNIIIGAGRFATLYYGTLKASKTMYQQLLRRILRAPMRFFDTTPIGRILNRFSKDFEYIDSGVPNDLMYFLIQWLIIISAILTVCTVLPIFIFPMILVTVLNINIGKKFSAASRELRRMDSVTRSPLFTHFGETIVGVATIRAYGVTRQFMNEMLKRVDENSRPFYYAWIANRWVGVRFSFLGATVNFFTGIFILFSLSYIDASLAGFCLSFVMSYTSQVSVKEKNSQFFYSLISHYLDKR